jgi:hypothetical protein
VADVKQMPSDSTRVKDSAPLPGPRGKQPPVNGEASVQSQQRTHTEPIGPRGATAFELEVPFSPEALDIIRQRYLQRYVDLLGNPHLQPGILADLFADLEALAKTRPQL